MTIIPTTSISLGYKDTSPFGILGGGTTSVVEEKKDIPKLALLEILDISLKPAVDKKANFLSFAGIWKDVDTERIKKEITRLRKKSARTIKAL